MGSSPTVRTTVPLGALLGAALALGGCGARDDGTITASVIGVAPRLVDPDRAPLTASARVLGTATAMGLVSFDASGQVEPALAESWIVTDDGLSTIFRIRRTAWPDGGEVTGEQVAASLARAIAPGSRNALKPLMSAVGRTVGMTGRVVEIRLRVPRPNLLQLLAQPEFGIRRGGRGIGPWRAAALPGGALRLRLIEVDADADPDAPRPATPLVTLRGERASLAIVRFQQGESQLVLGGTLADWPLALLADIRRNRIRVDPAQGLFGLAVTGTRDFLKHDDLRAALSMAIDRDDLVATFGVPRWQSADRLLPARLDSAQPPAAADWTGTPLDQRRAEARRRVAAWNAARGPEAPLRVALPPGPAMRVLFAHITAGWRAIGVEAVMVDANAPGADLRLIDEVAPSGSANWYLTRTSCEAGVMCDDEAMRDLIASRAAPTLADRAAAIARADAAAAAFGGYIALARPVRWSLVDPSLTGFHENPLAIHPLAELR